MAANPGLTANRGVQNAAGDYSAFAEAGRRSTS